MSGCSTFTKNGVVAESNGTGLSIAELNSIAADFPTLDQSILGIDENGEFAGDTLRTVITSWIQATTLFGVLEERGVVDDAARTQQAAAFEADNGDVWTQLAPATQDFLVDLRVGQNAFSANEGLVEDGAAEQAYNRGVQASGVLCLRIMAFATLEEAAAVKAELDGGVSFAELADEHPLDPTGEPNGGELADPQTGNPCTTAESVAPVVEPLATTPIGTSSEPFSIEGGYFLVLQRPYDEVAEGVRSLIAPAITRQLVAAADIRVDSRYGMWDSETGTVVPTR